MMFFHKDWSKESSKFLQQTEEELLHETCRNLLTQIVLELHTDWQMKCRQKLQTEVMKNRYLSELLCGIIIQLSLIKRKTEDRLNDKKYDGFWQRGIL